jgi:5-carboxymethyl-2-hydroxymuconate isomerase
MPHFIVEFSNNLPEDALDVPALLETLSETAVNTGLVPKAGIRARAHRATYQRVGTGDTANGFVHVAMNVGQGRSEEDRKKAGEIIFEATKNHMAALLETHKIALSFEMREIDTVKFNFKNT